MKDWSKLTSKEKIAKLDEQLEDIEAGMKAFKEFRRLTNEWLTKIKDAAKSKSDDDE